MMGSGLRLLWITFLGLLFKGVVITGDAGTGKAVYFADLSIRLDQTGSQVTLHCEAGDGKTIWSKDGVELEAKGQKLVLGSALDDPRGLYQCRDEEDKKRASLQVFFRMCQNCIQLNWPTILGILLASVVATMFLATAVYCIAVEEPGWQPQASDKQTLLANEQLYQPLRERSNGQYSHIGVAKTRRR